MDKAEIYIKKLIALAIAGLVFYGTDIYFPWTVALPFAFLVLSFLHFRITDIKPDYLYGLSRSDDFLNNKGGLWMLFKLIVTLPAFIYDIIVWTIHGVYVLFIIFIDFLLLIKTVIYWIIHAILWFLKLFVPPIIFIYKVFIHYFIFWLWWIYRVAFRNVGLSAHKNFFLVALWGSVPALFIFVLFYGVGLLMDLPAIVAIGIVFSILPVVWSYGEISAMRHEDRFDEDYSTVRLKFKSGFDAIKAVSFYLIIFLLLLLTELILNMFGWIPVVGFSLLGISLNISTFASLLLLFIFVILLFAKFMLPPHVVIDEEHENDLDNSVKFLGVIGRKFLRYLLSLIPAGFFSAILAVIPAIIVYLAVLLTLNIKDAVIDTRITAIEAQNYTLEGEEKYIAEKRADRLSYFLEFPQNVFNDFTSLTTLIENRKSLEKNIETASRELEQIEYMFNNDVDSIQNRIEQLKVSSGQSDSIRVERLEATVERKTHDFESWKMEREDSIMHMEYDQKDLKAMIIQLPLVFLFVMIWIAFIGGLVLAVVIAYLGNVFYDIYLLQEDGKQTYFRQVVLHLNEKDRKQPLLGFTIMVLIIVGLFLLSRGFLKWPF